MKGDAITKENLKELSELMYKSNQIKEVLMLLNDYGLEVSKNGHGLQVATARSTHSIASLERLVGEDVFNSILDKIKAHLIMDLNDKLEEMTTELSRYQIIKRD